MYCLVRHLYGRMQRCFTSHITISSVLVADSWQLMSNSKTSHFLKQKISNERIVGFSGVLRNHDFLRPSKTTQKSPGILVKMGQFSFGLLKILAGRVQYYSFSPPGDTNKKNGWFFHCGKRSRFFSRSKTMGYSPAIWHCTSSTYVARCESIPILHHQPFHSQEWSIPNFSWQALRRYHVTQYEELGFS